MATLSALFKISNSYSDTYKTLQILRYLRATYHLRVNIEVMEGLLLSFLTVLQGVFGGFNHHAKRQKKLNSSSSHDSMQRVCTHQITNHWCKTMASACRVPFCTYIAK